jgi:hypothetical protein
MRRSMSPVPRLARASLLLPLHLVGLATVARLGAFAVHPAIVTALVCG